MSKLKPGDRVYCVEDEGRMTTSIQFVHGKGAKKGQVMEFIELAHLMELAPLSFYHHAESYSFDLIVHLIAGIQGWSYKSIPCEKMDRLDRKIKNGYEFFIKKKKKKVSKKVLTL